MLRRNIDLLLISALALAGLAVQLPGVPAVIHISLGFLLAVLCPGYALLAALFPAGALGWAERAAFTLGLSLTLAILGAVVLNAAPWGLITPVWAGLSVAATLAASVVAGWRRRRAAPLPRRPGLHLRPLDWAQLGLAGLVTVGAIWLVRVPIAPSGVVGYTLLTITPDKTPNQPGVSLAISSSEFTTTNYTLTVTHEGQPVRAWQTITLAPGEKWQQIVTLSPAQATGRIEAMLYRLNDPGAVYRSVSLVLGP